MDDISAIKFCAEQLHIDFKKNLFNDDQYVEDLFKIDEKTHIIVERISTHYINIDHINNDLEERIENTVFLYHRQIYLIYISLIEHLAPINHKSVPIMLARAMNSATQMIKWRYYSYQSAPANVWLQISQLYKIALERSLLNESLQAYPDQKHIKFSTAYIQACMLGNLESLSLKSQQIELVSQMLAAWTSNITIDDVYDEAKHLFFVDTATNGAAKRIRNFKPADSYRYWCFDDFNINIELCLSLIEFNITPNQHTIKHFVKNPYALATLEVLRAEWSRLDYKRQRRSEDRIKTVKSVTTAYGFEDICNQLKQYESPKTLSARKSAPSEDSLDERLASIQLAKSYAEPNVIYMDFGAGYSNVVDESIKGLGLHISKRANEVSLGMMVCVTIKEQKNISKIGVIRSIRPIAGGELHIGVEVISTKAVRAEAKTMNLNAPHADTKSSNSMLNLSINTSSSICLYLPKEDDISIHDSLILTKHQYNKDGFYKINILNEDLTLKLTDILEQREDWIRVNYSAEH
jgi:hypothetical protein